MATGSSLSISEKEVQRLIRFLNDASGTHRSKTVRSSMWIGLSSLIAKSFDLVISVILARLLVPEIFGLVGIVIFIQQGIEVLTQTSFKQALIYRQDNVEQSVDTAWILSVIRGFLLFVLVFSAAPWISEFYGQPLLSKAVRFIALIFILDGFYNINMVLFDKSLDFKKIAISRMLGSFLYGSVALSLALASKSIWALLIGMIFRSLYSLCVSYLIQKRKPRFHFSKKLAGELIRYSKYVTGAGILVFFTTRGDDAIIGKILGMRELGFYAYAYMIANLPATHVTNILSEVFFPSYSVISGDTEKLRKIYLSVCKFVAYIAIPTGAGIFVLSRELVVLLLGAQWEPVIGPLKILLLFGVTRSLAATTGPVFKAVGKPNIIFYLTLGKLVFILSIIYPLTKSFGIMGSSAAVTIPMVAEQLYLWVILKKILNVSLRDIGLQLSRPFITGLVTAGTLTSLRVYFPVEEVLALGFHILLGIAVCGALAFALDRKYFMRILNG